jgi:hypothetical protein
VYAFFPTAKILVGHDPISCSEQGIITTTANVLARVYFGAALAYKDISGADYFTTKFLYAKPLGIAISSIAG